MYFSERERKRRALIHDGELALQMIGYGLVFGALHGLSGGALGILYGLAAMNADRLNRYSTLPIIAILTGLALQGEGPFA